MSINIKVNNSWKEATAGYCNVNGVWRKVNKICQNINGEWKCVDIGNSGEDPSTAPNGVYVYANNGKLYSPDSWDTSNNANAAGVAIITDNCRFAVSKSLPTVNRTAWSEALYDTDVADLTNYSNSSEAQTDYAGQSNTNIIRTQASGENSSNNAAHYCYEQTLNGQNGYLPAAGELYTLWDNKTEVNNALTTIGATTIDTALNNIYNDYHYLWSSTESSVRYVWFLDWESRSSPLRDDIGKFNPIAHSRYYAFPVFPITIS